MVADCRFRDDGGSRVKIIFLVKKPDGKHKYGGGWELSLNGHKIKIVEDKLVTRYERNREDVIDLLGEIVFRILNHEVKEGKEGKA